MTSALPTNQEFDQFCYYCINNDFAAMEEAFKRHGSEITNARNSVYQWTPLIEAARSGQVKSASLLLSWGADVDLQDKIGYTALHWATYKGDRAFVQLLLEEGADTTVINNEGKTAFEFARNEATKALFHSWALNPLFGAAARGDVNDVSRLLADGATIDAVASYGATALLLGLKRGRDSVAIKLLEHRAVVSVKNIVNRERTALHYAAQTNCGGSLMMLVELGLEVNASDNEGNTALMLALAAGHDGAAVKLLEYGADISLKNKDEKTALHFAADNNCGVSLGLLLERGADINALDKDGDTALHIAAYKNKTDSVVRLLETGSSPRIKNRDGKTASELTADTEIKQLFELFGAPYTQAIWNTVTASSKLPLLFAVERKNDELLTQLIGRGANVHITDKSGRTALHIACAGGYADTAILLLQKGVDVAITDKDDVSALDVAVKNNHESVVRALLKNGAVSLAMKKSKRGVLVIDEPNFADVRRDFLLGNIVSLSYDMLSTNNFSLWFYMVQVSETSINGIGRVVKALMTEWPVLAEAVDADGRVAIGVATKENALAIQSVLFVRERFEILPGPPVHRSISSVVYIAYDHSTSNAVKAKVALKFMSEKEQFDREIICRLNASLDPNFVIGIINTIDDFSTNDVEKVKALREVFDLSDFRFFYVIIMPAASKSMDAIYRTERPDDAAIRSTMRSLGAAIQSVHNSGLMHGDLKLLNILRTDDKQMKLIDLDASAMIQDGFVGAKFSSGILPPEMFAVLTVEQKEKFESYFHKEKEGKSTLWNKIRPVQFGKTKFVVVKTFLTDELGNPRNPKALPYELMPAARSVDLWSFGALLYNMLSKDCLMNVNRDDDLSAESVVKVASWSDEAIRREVLLNIRDGYAADLLFHLLRISPEERMQSFDDVLIHPYFNENTRSENADRVNEALSVVKSELALVEEVSRRCGLIAGRTRVLEGVSEKVLSQLLKTEKTLLRDGKVFNSADTDFPTCFTIVRQRLTNPRATSDSTRDATATSILSSAMAKELLIALAKFGTNVSELVDRGGEDVLKLCEDCSSLCEAFVKNLVAKRKTVYLYLLDEYTMQPVVGVDDSLASNYPIVIDKPYETVLALLPLWRISLKATVALKGVNGIARCVGFPSHSLPSSLKDEAHMAAGKLDQNNSILEYDLLQVGTVKGDIADARAVRGVALQQLSQLFAAKDPMCRFADLKRVWTANTNVSCWASEESVELMEQNHLWFGRFKVENRPEHMSSTTIVYKAVDESSLDESGNPVTMALKMMFQKQHFLREVKSREVEFDKKYVMNILMTFPDIPTGIDVQTSSLSRPSTTGSIINSMPLHDRPELVVLEGTNSYEMRLKSGQLKKAGAENLFCIVMPFADRNLYVAMKQELFNTTTDLEFVKYLFSQLVKAVEHIHSKGVMHGDVKPMNVVRNGTDWSLIDLDAACKFGEPVGHKWSSAYMPPEAVFVGEVNGKRVVMVKSVIFRYRIGGGEIADAISPYDPLLAHPSFDIWSLGCIFFQLCTGVSLMKEGQDDNLSDDINDPDSLGDLAAWTDEFKNKKLSKIVDAHARNLASLLLMKDPMRRATISRINTHPFITGKNVSRLSGVRAKYHVFLSYRVNSDLEHAKLLYKLLTDRGLVVWLDKECLEPGKPWKEGFIAGLVDSLIFVCLWSKDAINHPTNGRQSFARLTEDSTTDNVLLEHALALELLALGFLMRLFPVLIGEYDAATDSYSDFFETGGFPKCPNVVVKALKADVQAHMASQGLGSPLYPDVTVSVAMRMFSSMQGGFVKGKRVEAFNVIAGSISDMVRSCSDEAASGQVTARVLSESEEVRRLKVSLSKSHDVIAGKDRQLLDVVQAKDAELSAMEAVIASKEAELAALKEAKTTELAAKDAEIATLRTQLESVWPND